MRVVTCLALLGSGCGAPAALSLAVTPATLPGDGETPATVVATVTRAGASAEGVPVRFTASLGVFEEALAGTPGTVETSSGADGKAVATLVAPRQGWGRIAIVASAAVDGQEARAVADVTLLPSGGPADALELRCGQRNIGAFVTGRTSPIEVPCTATARRGTASIAKASIQTLSEAGVLDWVPDGEGHARLVYTVVVGAAPPRDVDPLDARGNPAAVCPAGCASSPGAAYDAAACPGEPCWLDAAGVTHNPRDGLVTLLAAVPSRSADSQGEPWLDTNDNGVRDASEPYLDFNGNGKWDGPDGQIKDRLLWKVLRLVWSGEADRSPSAHASFLEVEGAAAIVRLHDRNFNALAAAGPAGTDLVAIEPGACTGDGRLATTPAAAFLLAQDEPGIALDPETGRILAPGLHSSWLRGTEYGLRGSLAGSTTPQACGVTLNVRRQYAPGDGGDLLDTEALSATFSF